MFFLQRNERMSEYNDKTEKELSFIISFVILQKRKLIMRAIQLCYLIWTLDTMCP
jgi:hypothetical protein